MCMPFVSRNFRQTIKRVATYNYALIAFFALATPQATTGHAMEVKEIEDSSIATAIDGELWEAKGVDANDIDVSVNQGVVTLTGEVDNILSKERALRIARMTKGVRSVVNQLSVDPAPREDEELRRDIQLALKSDPTTDSWKIQVQVADGTVTLGGAVESYTQQQLASNVTKGVRGVKDVVNNVTINYDSIRTDSEIETEIESRYAWDVRLDDENVDVEVENGEVTLSGFIGSDYEKTVARWDAWVTGVKSVNDEKLLVKWWTRPDPQRPLGTTSVDDEEIRDAVKNAFLYDPRVSLFNPVVSVNNGTVTLTGIVDNLKAKRAAAQDARNTTGVWRVKNYLKVRPADQRSDGQIAADVRAALLRDPFVDRMDIHVSVYGGTVYLRGDVDSYYEKEHAEDIAARVKGATDVGNYLTVGYDYPSLGYDFYDWDATLYDYDFDYETVKKKSDKAILDDIESELFWSPFVDSDAVSVAVNDGIATLTGTVDSWSERSAAAENALEGGAFKVVNKLAVQD